MSVRKEQERHPGAANPHQLVVRWQAEPLQPLEINCRAESRLQPGKEPTAEQETDSTEVHDSKGRTE